MFSKLIYLLSLILLVAFVLFSIFGWSYIVLGTSRYLPKKRKDKVKEKKRVCIHLDSDCEECFSQSGCTLKNENIISIKEE